MLVLAAGLLWPASAFSQADQVTTFLTGNQLYEYCTSQTNVVAKTMCLGYVAGTFDTLDAMGMTCRPNEVTMGQAQDMITNYLRDHPETRHLNGADLVGAVLAKTFPCKKQAH
jgi:hypothetical protein